MRDFQNKVNGKLGKQGGKTGGRLREKAWQVVEEQERKMATQHCSYHVHV